MHKNPADAVIAASKVGGITFFMLFSRQISYRLDVLLLLSIVRKHKLHSLFPFIPIRIEPKRAEIIVTYPPI
jgi:hypothetical protein